MQGRLIEITTPKKYVLNGFWLGPARPKKVVIWVHGLGSTMFSKLRIADMLANKDTAVIIFNNRGHDTVASVPHATKNRLLAGCAHEVFTDCVDDIQGVVNFARRSGAKNIFLAGHSTGCQKSTYWAYKTGARGVKGIVLLAPMSDYAADVMINGRAKVEKGVRTARALVRRGKKHTFLPDGAWPSAIDAQRFLSLYDLPSAEETFPYARIDQNSKALKSMRVPLLILLAEKDEYGDRPATKIADWFRKHMKVKDSLFIIPRVRHSFKGGERKVVNSMHRWMNFFA